MSTEPEQTNSTPLALPAPDQAPQDATQSIRLDSETLTSLKFDSLGPMVVNSDGTLSRITNWDKMTELERERTIRVLNARNKLRLANELQKQGNSNGDGEALEISRE